MSSRVALFKKSANRNYEFERYLISSEPTSIMKVDDIVIDSTRSDIITLPLSYFISKDQSTRSKGKADPMPFESFRMVNLQHRGGRSHSLILIKSRAIQSNPHHLAIFDSNGRNRFCSVRILDDHNNSMKNVTKAYTTISPDYNINYGSDKHNPGYCGIFGIICIVAFRHYRRKTGTLWIAKWKKLLAHMSQCINPNAGCMGVELAARVQEIIASTPSHSCAEREIAAEIQACLTHTPTTSHYLIL